MEKLALGKRGKYKKAPVSKDSELSEESSEKDSMQNDGKPGKLDTRKKAKKKIQKLEDRAVRLLNYTKKDKVVVDGKKKRGKKAKQDYIPEQIEKMRTMWGEYFMMPNSTDE